MSLYTVFGSKEEGEFKNIWMKIGTLHLMMSHKRKIETLRTMRYKTYKLHSRQMDIKSL